jgi:hypothetical protein
MSITRNGFQANVNTVNPPGKVGDFASMNPRATVNAGPGQLKAGTGVRVGYFARADLSTGLAEGVVSPGSGILGFVANENQTLITDFLADSRMTVQGGFPVTLYTHGDFWALVGGGAVTVGATIYAVAATGEPTVDSASSANPDTGFIAVTAAPADPTCASCTIAAGTGVLTMGAAPSAAIVASGMNVSGTGVPANVNIVSQLTGTAGGANGATFQTNYQGPAVASFTATVSQGRLVKISRTY